MKICALEELKELMACFPGSYINQKLELILIPKTNTYFKIEDCECHLDVKEKLLTWCSRTIAKGQPYANPNKNIAFRHYNLKNLNKYLHRNFNENDIGIIYQKLGNGINPELAKKFIGSHLNMEVLMTEKLGVLLVDVPEPKWWKYYYLENSDGDYNILKADEKELVESQAVLCTQEEAKKYPQFRWVALEEL